MRRMLFVFLLVLCLMLSLVSCSDEGGTATMKLMLKKMDLGAKTLLPVDASSLQITRYRIRGSGPNNGEFDISTDNTSVTINGLEVGSWNVNAWGLNNSGTELVQGTTVYDLTQNSGTAQVVLDQMVGNGTMLLTIDWTNTELPDPSLEVFITPQGGTEGPVELNPDYANRTVSISKSLAAGSYIIRGVLKSGDFHVGGFVDSVRIIGGQTTEGEISISQMQFADASGFFLLTNKAGEPVRGRLTGFGKDSEENPILDANIDKVIAFSLDNYFESSPGLQIQWFLDGIPLGQPGKLDTRNEKTVNVSPGSHRIDAVVNNSLIGSYGCVSVSFMAVLSGTKGSLNKLSDFSTILISKDGTDCTYLKLQSDTMVSPLPSGKFLLISPSQKTIAVMKVVRNYLDLVRVYSERDFPFIGNIRMVKSDSVLPWVVLLDNSGSTENLTFLKFNQDTGELSRYDGLSRVEGRMQPFENFVLDIGRVDKIEFAGARNYIYFLDNTLKTNGKPDKKMVWFEIVDDSVVLRGYNDMLDAILPGVGFSVSPSCEYFARTIAESTQFGVAKCSLSGGYYEYKRFGNTTSAAGDIIFVSDNCVILANGSLERFTIDFQALAKDAVLEPQILDITSSKIVLNTEKTHLYAMDAKGRTIYSILINSNGLMTKIGQAKISQNSGTELTTMALAGSYLLVASDSGNLTLCKVVE